MNTCKSINCSNPVPTGEDFCTECTVRAKKAFRKGIETGEKLSDQYPHHYKSVDSIDEIDAFGVLHLFNIQDPSGCIQHATQKLLLSGSPTVYSNVKQARDSLNRWLELNATADL